MKIRQRAILMMAFFIVHIFWCSLCYAQEAKAFSWPNGKTVAVSLSWDDGRESQVTIGTPILDEYGVKATFYVVPSSMKKVLKAWKSAVDNGHEIGNHSLVHPCSGNFKWSRDKALEDYTVSQMQTELTKANEKIQEMLGVFPTEFAYPCGQTFVGRGTKTMSYVPVVSEQFTSGRTWLDEAANDPAYCDLAQITGVEMDGKDVKSIKTLIENAREEGLWLVLAGHDIGSRNRQTTEVKMLKRLLPYLTDPENKIWVAPVGEISAYIKASRGL